MLNCPYCGANKSYKKGYSQTGLQRYICRNCDRKFTEQTIAKPKPIPRTDIKNCLACGKKTTNPKFCSRNCAAKHNNTVAPKRLKKPKFCKYCGVKLEEDRRVCANCTPYVDWSKRTLGEVRQAAKYQPNAQARDVARQEFKKSKRPAVCQNCGYSKHIEVCHIIAVKDFPPETPMSVVNGINNLVALCPNCHWEFDHGVLHIEDIPGYHSSE